MTNEHLSRRGFFQRAATAAVLADQVLAQTSGAAPGVPTRVLGRTGQRVSILCLGGYHAATHKDEKESIRLMHTAVNEGVTFFDNCWDYHSGHAEDVMGKALAMDGYRKKVFLMTKNCGRDYDETKKCLDDSLRRLRTDHLDLWQFHELVYDNDPDWIMERGALKAALEAQKAGKVRYIGFTGHKDPVIHLKTLGKPHPWDTSQMPINVCDAHYRSFQLQVIPECLKRNVGVIGMKGLGGGYPTASLVAKAGLKFEECIRFCLSLPVASQVVGFISVEQLMEGVRIARAFKPMAPAEKQSLISRVKDVAGDGRYEAFKSTKNHDSLHHRRQHGFDEKSA
jgi:predicted aldo/keto reductase-like oxidoreductase